jgi:ferredoxin
MRVWIDQDLCTGDGLCTDHCPEVFVLLEDGISYVREGSAVGNEPGGARSTVLVPRRLEAAAVNAALDCPGECIFLESDPAGQDWCEQDHVEEESSWMSH